MYTDPFISLLISGDELEANLSKAGLVVIDARSAGYEAGHIPGAISLEWSDYVKEDMNLKTTRELEDQLGEAGLSNDMVFVVYDDTTASWGAAGRVFWMLEYLGCDKVHMLNGGWDKWISDGRATEMGINTLPRARFAARVQDDALMNKDRLADRLGDDDFVVVDSRTDEEYNGWTLYGEARGGHITGAVQLPYAGFFKEDKTILDYDVLKELFESHGITSDKEVTAYCTVGIRSGFIYFVLRTLGYPRVSNYDGSISEWSADNSLPMEKMENYQALVYPDWVDKLIKGENPPTYPGNGYVILYTSYEPRYSENRTDYVGTVYETGHIPGAIFMDVYSLENGPNSEYGEGYEFPEEGNVKPIPELQEFLGSLGISKDMTVVVYADDDITMMTAGRTAWALLLAGVDVRLLNGNYAAWVAYGGNIETTPNTLAPVDFGDDPGNPQYVATTDDVLAVANGINTNAVIADDRSWEEFIGDSNSYYHYFNELGRIKAARWIGDWWEVTQEDFQSLKTYTEVEQNWIDSGFTADKPMYFYCGTGWRSGLYTFYAYLMGWPAANYDGGWFEWSVYGNPRETGLP
jgi:thiosulfate/3-mercaptopyruvate sulfurtransferase